jgi:hypothetical protein
VGKAHEWAINAACKFKFWFLIFCF